jgi:hypothetical protein
VLFVNLVLAFSAGNFCQPLALSLTYISKVRADPAKDYEVCHVWHMIIQTIFKRPVLNCPGIFHEKS